jgi:hypothetical protein
MNEKRTTQKLTFFLIGLTAFAALLTSLPVIQAIRDARKQAAIVAHVQSLGGQVDYDFYFNNPNYSPGILHRILGDDLSGSVVQVDLSATTADDDDIKLLLELPELTWLELYETAITNKALEDIGKMKRLEFLWLDKTAISDEGISHLSNLQSLKELVLQYVPITDAAMPQIAKLRGLRSLGMGQTQITDQGVQQVVGLPLEHLKLDGTKITDGVGPTLAQFPNLVMLDLSETQVTDAVLSGANRWLRLEFTRLHDTGITDKSIPVLAGIRTLKAISLGSGVTPQGAAQLQQALPQCSVSH